MFKRVISVLDPRKINWRHDASNKNMHCLGCDFTTSPHNWQFLFLLHVHECVSLTIGMRQGCWGWSLQSCGASGTRRPCGGCIHPHSRWLQVLAPFPRLALTRIPAPRHPPLLPTLLAQWPHCALWSLRHSVLAQHLFRPPSSSPAKMEEDVERFKQRLQCRKTVKLCTLYFSTAFTSIIVALSSLGAIPWDAFLSVGYLLILSLPR